MSRFAQLDALLQDLVNPANGADSVPNGIAVLARNSEGEEIYRGKSGTQIDHDTVLRMASCSKMISPIILLQAVEHGFIEDLDEPVQKYVPDFNLSQILKGFDDKDEPIYEKATRSPTWTELANHSSGLVYIFELELFARHQGFSWPVELSKMGLNERNYKGPLLFEPGTSYRYAGGLGTMGLILQRIIGKDLDQLLQEWICQPLGLTRTTFRLEPESQVKLYGRKIPGDYTSEWEYRERTFRTDATLGDASIASCADEFIVIVGEVLKALKGKPNKLFKDGSQLPQSLLAPKMSFEAKQALYEDIRPRWAKRPIAKDWKAQKWHFGLGYLVNEETLEFSGRKANSLFWDGAWASACWIDPTSDIVLHVFCFIDNAMDPVSRNVHDSVEQTFYKCLAE